MSTRGSSSVLVVGICAIAIVSFGALHMIKKRNKRRRSSSSNPIEDLKDSTAAADNDAATRKNASSNQSSLRHLPPHIERQLYKERRREEKAAQFSCKKPVYDNMRMYDPSDELLCTISKKKANWYIRKGLAVWKNDEHTAIRLQFEPKRKKTADHNENVKKERTLSQQSPPVDKSANIMSGGQFEGENANDDIYLKSTKSNHCVCCGSSKHYRRHYIVPYAYRKHFPSKFKSHLSHDVVVLCSRCQLVCERYYQERMKDLEEDSCIDECTGLRMEPEPPVIVDSELYHVRSCALALLRGKDKLPEDKIINYDRTVRDHLNVADGIPLTPDQLQEAIDVEYRRENPNFIPPAARIVDNLKNEAGIATFVMEWRHFFVDRMSPRHLPNGWSVDLAVMSN